MASTQITIQWLHLVVQKLACCMILADADTDQYKPPASVLHGGRQHQPDDYRRDNRYFPSSSLSLSLSLCLLNVLFLVSSVYLCSSLWLHLFVLLSFPRIDLLPLVLVSFFIFFPVCGSSADERMFVPFSTKKSPPVLWYS